MAEVIVTEDPFEAAVARLAAMLASIEAETVRLAIPGGSAAAVAPAALARAAADGFEPSRLALTWVDERCVPVASSDSNRGSVAFDPAPGATLPLFEDGETPAEAVARVGAGLGALFARRLDVVLLGLGEDGHIASLFPDGAELEGPVAHVGDSPKPPSDRITLTRPLLATARHTLVYAVGEGKRAALRRLVVADPDLPATGLPGLVVVTDQKLS